MIKRVYTYEREYGYLSVYTMSYNAICFEDDQSYYKAVTWMREEHGRAGSYREKTPTWTHHPETLTIGLRWTADIMNFLKSEYGWCNTTIFVRGPANSTEVRKWCDQRSYLCSVKYGSIDICVPSEKDLLMARLRFSDHAVPEPVF